jgi:hypothetical protein
VHNLVRAAARFAVCVGCVASCGDGDSVDGASTVDSGLSPSTDAEGGVGNDAGQAIPRADAGPSSGAGCDLSGVWIARQNTESLALSLPQYANTWYYFELTQSGDSLTVARHFDCGIEVRGTVRVMLMPATTRALLAHNLQAGRKGTVTPTADGQCSVSIEPFWSVRGVPEDQFVPTPRNSGMTLAQVQAALPLPTADMVARTEDWDGDGKPGITWFVNGIVNGERNTIQRDWTRYFSAPGYAVTAGSDFGDVVLRTEFSAEEVVFNTQGLSQLSQPNAAAEHTLTLRFLGRTPDDARARAIYGADDFETCAKVRATLPSTQALR